MKTLLFIVSLIFFTSFTAEMYSQSDDVKLTTREPNIIDLEIPPTDYLRTVEVYRIIKYAGDTAVLSKKGTVITVSCYKPLNSWWVAKAGIYQLLVSRQENGEKVILKEEIFNIGS